LVGWSAAAAAGLTFLPARWWCPDDGAPRTGASEQANARARAGRGDGGRTRAPPFDGNGRVCATRDSDGGRSVCERFWLAGGQADGKVGARRVTVV